MATGNNSRDVKMTLSVETLGEENVKKLQSAVANLATQGGDAAPEFQRLADEIGRIGEQASALQAFTQLAEQTAVLAQRQEQTSAASTELRTKLDALSLVTQEAADRQRAAATALADAQQAARATRDELATLTVTTDRAGKAEATYTDEVQRLKLAKIEQRAEIEKLSGTLAEANQEVKVAEDAEAKLASTYARTAASADQASRALEDNKKQVEGAAVAAGELGVSTDNIASAQAQLVQALNRTGTAATELQQGVDKLAERERELVGIRAFEEQVQAASRLQQTAEYTKLFDEALRQLADSERALKAESNEQQWQQEAEALVETAHAAQQLAHETAVLEAAQAELSAQRAFEKQSQDASQLIQAASYVRFWREELDRAEVQAQQTAAEAKLAAERISNAFSTLGVRSAEDLRMEIAQVRAAMETVRTSAGLTGSSLNTAFAAGNNRIQELERDIRKASGTLTLADRSADAFKNSLNQITAGNVLADGIGYLVQKVKSLAIAFVTTIVQAEQLRRGLMAVYKDSAVAASQFQFLKTTATQAGVSINDIAKSFVTFSASTRASGISLEVTNKLFAEVSRAAGTLGLSGEQVSGMLEALQQMASKGTVAMEELRQQLGDRLPGALSLIAKGLGLTDAELIKLVENGGLAARDLFPALTKALGEMRGSTDGLLPSYERLKNVLFETAQNAGDSGWTQILTGALGALTEAAAMVILPLSALTEVIFGAAKAAGILVAALFTLTNPIDALKELVTDAAERQGKLDAAFVRTIDSSKRAADAQAAHNAKMSELGTVAAEASTAITTTAKAQEAQAFAAKLAADSTFDLSSKIVQLKAFIDQLLSVQSKQIEASGKLAKAAKIEGDALVQLAQLRGQDFITMSEQVTATEKTAAALGVLADAQRTETELLVFKRDEIIKTAIAQDGNTKARSVEINEINKKIVASQAETEQSKQAAVAAEQEVKIRKLAVETYKDNSARVGEFKKAMDAATVTLEAMTKAQALGLADDKDMAKAKERVATATALFNDGIKDSIYQLGLESRVKQANMNITLTKLQLEQRNYESLAQAAKASGDFRLVLYYEVEARLKQIEAIKLSSAAKKLDAEATIKGLEIERAALAQTDPLIKQKQAEIDIRIANAKAKLLEANAGKDAIATLEREISALRDNENARGRGTNGINRDTGARDANTASIDKGVEALEKEIAAKERAAAVDRKLKGVDINGMATDASGNTFATSSPTRRSVFDQASGAGLNDATSLQIAKQFVSDNGNLTGGNGSESWYMVVYKAIQKAWEMQMQTQIATGSATGAAPAAAPTTVTPRVQTIRIIQSGRSTDINVASQTDANNLTGVLRQLESAAGAAS